MAGRGAGSSYGSGTSGGNNSNQGDSSWNSGGVGGYEGSQSMQDDLSGKKAEQDRAAAAAAQAAEDVANRKRAQRQEIYDDAYDFRKNLPKYTADRVRGLIPTYNESLSEGERRTRESFGRRGLSGSGLARAADTKFRGSLASTLAQAKVGIRMEGEQSARAKEQASAALGLSEAQRLMANAEQLYNLNAVNDIARRKSLGQLATGIGYGVGSYYGANSVQDESDPMRGGVGLLGNTGAYYNQSRAGLLGDYNFE